LNPSWLPCGENCPKRSLAVIRPYHFERKGNYRQTDLCEPEESPLAGRKAVRRRSVLCFYRVFSGGDFHRVNLIFRRIRAEKHRAILPFSRNFLTI
jgi:predicted cupin superfamily sugar epimerase